MFGADKRHSAAFCYPKHLLDTITEAGPKGHGCVAIAAVLRPATEELAEVDVANSNIIQPDAEVGSAEMRPPRVGG